MPRPRKPSALVPPPDEPSEKACVACGELKPITAFYLNTGRNGVVKRRARCGPCYQVGRPTRVVERREKCCARCGEVKPLTKEHFYWVASRERWASMCCPCSAASARERYDAANGGLRTRRQRRTEVEVRHILDPELDRLRKALASAPPAMETDTERLAYLRGFFAAQSRQASQETAVERNQDLVFRIASEMRRHTYEDRVSYAYEALMECVRAGIDSREEIATAIRAKITDTKTAKFLRTNLHACGSDGEWDRIAEIEAPLGCLKAS